MEQMVNDPDGRATALERYTEALGRHATGLVEVDLTPLDRLGVPVVSASVWLGGASCSGTGYGADRETARLSAFGELVETVVPLEAWDRLAHRRGTYRALARAGVPAVDPRRLCLTPGDPDPRERELGWVEGRRYPGGEPVWIPGAFVAPEPDLVPEAERIVLPITNGMGAGDTFERALTHGLLELVQRDGNSVTYRALDRGTVVGLDEVRTEATRALLARFEREGIDLLVKLAATDLGMANLYVVGVDRDPARAPHPVALGACGEAAHPDREVALGKALREFAASRCRRVFAHGPLEVVRRVAPEAYLDAFRIPGGSGEARAFTEMRAWAGLDPVTMRDLLRDRVLRVTGSVPLSTLPTAGGLAEPGDVLAALGERFAAAGLEILYVDFTGPGAPARVVRAVVPGFEVETMSYHRIGRRNVGRLLGAGADFVGLGEPVPGSRPVVLTEEDERGLGGPAWFHPGRADEIVGDLYPLYREPGRHAVALAAEDGAARAG